MHNIKKLTIWKVSMKLVSENYITNEEYTVLEQKIKQIQKMISGFHLRLNKSLGS